MFAWSDFEASAPELAARGRSLLERFEFVFVGTIRPDGGPRINPCEAYVLDGHLLLNMMPRSLKALDLLRDDRVYLHTPVTAKADNEGEFKLVGRALVCEDARLRTLLDDLFWRTIEWRPAPDSHYFDIDVERAAYVNYVDGEQLLERWRR